MLEQASNVFIVGIKGVAMANLAIILKKMGKNVRGADAAEEYITDESLKTHKINYQTGFEAEKLPKNIDLVIYSAAHGGINNSIVGEAKKRNVKTSHQAQILGELTTLFKTTIAVCGCHGKTTTSALLAYALKNLGEKPSYLVGTSTFADCWGGDYADKNYFVIEADEYGVNPPADKTPKFLFLKPNYILCTNIDFDHPDVYKNIEETKKAFLKFFENNLDSRLRGNDKRERRNGEGERRNDMEKKLILCADDKNLMEVAGKLPRESYLTYGYSKSADLIIINRQIDKAGTEFSVTLNKISNIKYQISNKFQISNFKFIISLFGGKNVSNAVGVILTLMNLGFKPEEIKKAIAGFTGAKRRFEKIYCGGGIELYDDYGHHPNEIKATIMAARDRFPKKRIIVIFQPHTYSRTSALLSEFAQSLSFADYGLVLPIFASAREKQNNFKVSSFDIEKIARKKNRKNIFAFENKQNLLVKLAEILRKDDVVFTIGAGDVYKLKEKIIVLMSNVKAQMSNKKSIFKKLQKYLGKDRVLENKDLFAYLTLHTDTKAEYYFEVKSRDDWQKALKAAHDLEIPIFILGGGSNIAVTKNIIAGLVVKNLYVAKEKIKETNDYVDFLVSSGYPTNRLVVETTEQGLAGLEYFKGLPGTVGGAIYMNSKWTKPLYYFSNNLLSAYLLDETGKIRKVDKDYFKFEYDFSILHRTKEILVEAVLRFYKTKNQDDLKKRANEAVAYRLRTQPTGVSSCGCFFRNIAEVDKERLSLPTTSVGYLIDKLNLKGATVGDFTISDVHGNFIINKGGKNGKAEDLKKLLGIVKSKVKGKYGIELEEEVILV